MKIIKSLGERGVLIKDANEIIDIEAKEQKNGFLGMLFGKLAASSLGRAVICKVVIPAGKGIISAR